MFDHIYVGADGSDSSLRAVRRADDLAARFDAPLCVITVHEPDTDPDPAAQRIREMTKAEIRTEAGDPAEVLLNEVRAGGADLLVLGNRGMRGTSRFLGSVPNKVSHHLSTSLLLVDTVTTDADRPYATVLVGTDGSETAGRAVAAAGEVAGRFGARLRVVHCYRGDSRRRYEGDAGTLLGPGYQTVAGGSAGRQAWVPLEAARRILATRDADYQQRRGDPSEVLTEMAAIEPDALLVAGSRGMTGPSRFLGSVPNSLTHRAQGDVLIVHTTA